jgi:1-acyl-sn-glycerol-3-phosphate acyltransferase
VPLITWPAFAEQLRTTGLYRTPVDLARTWGDRILGGIDLYCHAMVIGRVRHCAGVAKAGRLDRDCWAAHCMQAMQCTERCGAEVHISVPEPSRRVGPCVYVANHMSGLETVVLPCLIIPFSMPTIVVKKELLESSPLMATLRAVNAIPVTRTNPREDLRTVLERGRAAIESGTSVLIFPQSTRDPVFDPTTFNSIGAKLAARSGVPLVPIALRTDFVAPGRISRTFGPIHRDRPIHFVFGSPIATNGGAKAAHAEALAFLLHTLPGLGAQVGPHQD